MYCSPGSSPASAFRTVSPPTPESNTPIGASFKSSLRPHVRNQDDVTDRRRVREEHGEPVDADAEPGRGRHAVFEGADVVRVVEHGLLVAAFLALDLRAEPRRLVFGIVQLREPVRQ